MSALFKNAASSIRMGIEDFSAEKPERSLSAVRNLYAGILLLAKEVLARVAPKADPDEIIGARYKPVSDGKGGVTHVMDGHQTVDFETLHKRFKDFGLQLDRSALQDLNTIRNDIEHRFTDKPVHVVREAMAKSFPVTLQLFRLAQEDPRTTLGDAWPIMLEARQLYERELARCRETLGSVKWLSPSIKAAHLRCRDCESDLIEQKDPQNAVQEKMEVVCLACGSEFSSTESIIEAVDRLFGAEGHIRAMESGEAGPIFECSECTQGTYIEVDNMCAACGFELEWEDCARCYSQISLADALDGFDDGLCSYCSNLLDDDD